MEFKLVLNKCQHNLSADYHWIIESVLLILFKLMVWALKLKSFPQGFCLECYIKP